MVNVIARGANAKADSACVNPTTGTSSIPEPDSALFSGRPEVPNGDLALAPGGDPKTARCTADGLTSPQGHWDGEPLWPLLTGYTLEW